MIFTAPPPLILPPQRPAILRAHNMRGLPSWAEMQRREREATFPFPVFMPNVANVAIPPSVSYRTFLTDTTNLTTYTYTAADLGTADATRRIVIIAGGTSNGRVASSATIGGVSATKIAEAVDPSINATASMWIANVPSGTTGDIVITWNGSQGRCGVAVWALYNLNSNTPPVTPTLSGSATASLDMNISVGDILIVGGLANAGTASPTGYTERYDTSDAESERYSGGDYLATASESPRTITMAWASSPSVVACVAAAFR